MPFQLRAATSGVPLIPQVDGQTFVWSAAQQAWNFGAGGGGGGVTSWKTRVGAVIPVAGDYDSDQIDNHSAVAGISVTAALNTLNAAIDLTGTRVAAGPAGTFLAGTGAGNVWSPTFTAPTNPAQNGFAALGLNGDFTYLSPGTAGNMMNSNGSAWTAGVDFAALSPVTTAGFLANASGGFIRLGLVAGSGAGVASAAAGGNVRGARGTGGYVINVRNNADTADLTLLTTDTVTGPSFTLGSTAAGGFSPIIASPAAGTITLRVGSSATQVSISTAVVSLLIPILNFFTSVTNPTIQQQLDSVTQNGAGKKLFINAQDLNNTNTTGGDGDLRPGSGTTAGGKWRLMSGGGAVASAQRFAWNDAGIGFFTTAPTAQPTINGSRGANVALADLLTKVAAMGLFVDGTTL